MSFLHRRYKRWIFKVLLVVLVAGCASVSAPPPVAGGFVARGKLAVVQDVDSFSARFLWRQSGDHFAIDLWGPFGQGQVRLEGNGEELVLSDGAGRVLTRGTGESVMRSELGWSLPLAVLPDWVQGRSHPGLPVSGQAVDKDGRLVGFSQLDWHVTLGRYASVHPATEKKTSRDTDMPHLVSASQGVYRVRLAISEWQI